MPVPVLALPHDHHLAEAPRQRVLRLHLLEVHPHRLGPGEGHRAGGAAPGDCQGGGSGSSVWIPKKCYRNQRPPFGIKMVIKTTINATLKEIRPPYNTRVNKSRPN